ncbi:MAG: putative toxin-antitoxin system toxin component, PIN family [Candidatus Margulisbacteria bacterium]|nr:putative toxin-antitoxin system toxin component, PIN family [Candidatus Margulisiibacteriota bacterium]
MFKVVLDTNVFISAILFGGQPREILNSVIKGKIRLFVSEPILAGITNVLQRKKFNFPVDIIPSIINEIEAISDYIHTNNNISVIKEGPADNRVLECAVAANSDIIITGDKHLLNLKSYKNILITTPANFIKNYLI